MKIEAATGAVKSSGRRNTVSRTLDLAGPWTPHGIVVVTVLVVLPRLVHRASD